MAYKIAVASSDGNVVDLHFGSTSFFRIYTVDGLNYSFTEVRAVEGVETNNQDKCQDRCHDGHGRGCGDGCHTLGGRQHSVEIISDCRAVVAAKIGRNILKQLESKAISAFDIQMNVEEALSKIIAYYHKTDNRKYRLQTE